MLSYKSKNVVAQRNLEEIQEMIRIQIRKLKGQIEWTWWGSCCPSFKNSKQIQTSWTCALQLLFLLFTFDRCYHKSRGIWNPQIIKVYWNLKHWFYSYFCFNNFFQSQLCMYGLLGSMDRVPKLLHFYENIYFYSRLSSSLSHLHHRHLPKM